MKDGQPLTTDGSSHYTLTQTVTDRASSTYSNVLTVSEGAPAGVAGTYTCTVTNELGSESSEVTVGRYGKTLTHVTIMCIRELVDSVCRD